MEHYLQAVRQLQPVPPDRLPQSALDPIPDNSLADGARNGQSYAAGRRRFRDSNMGRKERASDTPTLLIYSLELSSLSEAPGLREALRNGDSGIELLIRS